MAPLWPEQDSSSHPRSGESEDESRASESGVKSSNQSAQRLESRSSSVWGAEVMTAGYGVAEHGDGMKPRSNAPPPTAPPIGSKRRELPRRKGDNPTVDVTSIEDPFEEFEVVSGSEKEFLILNLKNHAPKDEVDQLRRVSGAFPASFSGIVQEWDTTMNQEEFEETVRAARVSDKGFGSQDWQEFRFLQRATPDDIAARIYELIFGEQDENGNTLLPSVEYPAPILVLQKKVEEFTQSHVFMVNKHAKPTTLQRREFTRDVYDYARALGMGKHQANLEVMRARAAYRRDRGLAGGLLLDESDDESTLCPEINDAVEYVAFMAKGMQRGPVDPAGAWGEIMRLEAKIINSESPTRKRKRDMVENHLVKRDSMASKTPKGGAPAKPLNNRERRRLKAQQRHGKDSSQLPGMHTEKRQISSSRKHRRRNKRQKLLPLPNLESMQVRSGDRRNDITTPNITPVIQSDDKNISKAGVKGENETDVARNEEIFVKKAKGKSKAEKPPISNHGFDNNASGDLLRKRKKKRKRGNAKAATVSSDFIGIKNDKAQNSKATIDSNQAPTNRPNIDRDRVATKTALEDVGKAFKKESIDDSAARPLSGLTSPNSNVKMKGRRDRGRRKKSSDAQPTEIETAKDHHSYLRRKLSSLEKAPALPTDGDKLDDSIDVFTAVSQIPKTKCEVVIYTSCKTRRSSVMAEPDVKGEAVNYDSSTSVLESTFSWTIGDSAFTMSDYGSLDWDHSGPEFDGIKVEPKVTRSLPSRIEPFTPTKAVKTRNSSASLQTPQSHRKSREAIEHTSPTPINQVQHPDNSTSTVKKKPIKAPVKSPFFSPPASAEKSKLSLSEKKPRLKAGIVSCIPFPPLSSSSFGLLQERLWNDPFRLLVGVTFLNRTMGKHAIPAFYSLMEKYPTPAAILAADKEDIISITRHLGLQAQRAETYKKFAHFFLHNPPVKGRRYRVDHYPSPGDGMDIKPSEILSDSDPRVAWEIGHMTKGRYAIDSWRIFCRDVLRGEAEGWNGEGREEGFQPEWMRVMPRDKELIACLRWMWLKEGFEWDPVTGEREVAGRELMEAAIEGRVMWDGFGGMRILDEGDNEDG